MQPCDMGKREPNRTGSGSSYFFSRSYSHSHGELSWWVDLGYLVKEKSLIHWQEPLSHAFHFWSTQEDKDLLAMGQLFSTVPHRMPPPFNQQTARLNGWVNIIGNTSLRSWYCHDVYNQPSSKLCSFFSLVKQTFHIKHIAK